jgi:hypothetical protein
MSHCLIWQYFSASYYSREQDEPFIAAKETKQPKNSIVLDSAYDSFDHDWVDEDAALYPFFFRLLDGEICSGL